MFKDDQEVWPVFASDEIDAAAGVLESGRVNYWTGDEGRKFESEFAAYVGVRHAVAVANGTLALELALHALGIGPGDEVVVPARTFLATASCVVEVGATPIVCDIDRLSGVATAETIAARITAETRAIIVVHLAGWPCDMDAICELARTHELFVVEDCAQAHGATWRGRPVGSFGDVSAFSFCQDKIMTTCGEGGMVVTDDAHLHRRAWEYKDHGTSQRALDEAAALGGPEFKWVHESFGSNYRMSEVQSAVGRVQLRKLDDWVRVRRENAAILDSRLADVRGIRVAIPPVDAGHSYYKYYAYVEPEHLAAGWDRDRIVRAMRQRGVEAFTGACPEIYRERAFEDRGWGLKAPLPVAHELGQTSVMLLVDPTRSESRIHETADAIDEVMKSAIAR